MSRTEPWRAVVAGFEWKSVFIVRFSPEPGQLPTTMGMERLAVVAGGNKYKLQTNNPLSFTEYPIWYASVS